MPRDLDRLAALRVQAIEAMQTLPVRRAMAILKSLEEKGTKVKNPSGYLKAAVTWTEMNREQQPPPVGGERHHSLHKTDNGGG